MKISNNPSLPKKALATMFKKLSYSLFKIYLCHKLLLREHAFKSLKWLDQGITSRSNKKWNGSLDEPPKHLGSIKLNCCLNIFKLWSIKRVRGYYTYLMSKKTNLTFTQGKTPRRSNSSSTLLGPKVPWPSS